MISILLPLLASYSLVPTEQPEGSLNGKWVMSWPYKNPPITLKIKPNSSMGLHSYPSHLTAPSSPLYSLNSNHIGILFLFFWPPSRYSHFGTLAMTKFSLRKAKAFTGPIPSIRAQLKSRRVWPHRHKQPPVTPYHVVLFWVPHATFHHLILSCFLSLPLAPTV